MSLRQRADLDRDHPCHYCAVSAAAVCSPLEATALAEFRNLGNQVNLEPGEPLFHQGDCASQVFSLTSGVIKLYSILADGRRQVVAFHYPGEFIGFSEKHQYHCTAEAVVPASLCKFDINRFEEFARIRNDLSRSQRNQLGADLAGSQERTVLLGRASAREKVASFLLDIWQRTGAGTGLPRDLVDLPMSRADIGDYLGLTKETVSRQFSALRRAGVIRYGPARRLVIRDIERIRALAPAILHETIADQLPGIRVIR